MTDEQLKEFFSLAAVRDFRAVMDAPYAGEAEGCSLPYRRRQEKMLADPRRWCRERQKPLWRRAAQRAACLLLAGAAAFGTLMAASPTARAAVVQWFRAVFAGDTAIIQGADTQLPDVKKTTLKDSDGNAIGSVTHAGDVVVVESDLSMEELEERGALPQTEPAENDTPAEVKEAAPADTAPVTEDPILTVGSDGVSYINAAAIPDPSIKTTYSSVPQYAPTWLPETVRLEKVTGNHSYDTSRTVSEWRYRDGIGWLTLSADQSKKFTHVVDGLNNENYETVGVNGQAADYYHYGEVQRLYWDGGDATLMLEHDSYSYMSKETMIKIAESVQKLTVPAAYSIKWMPEGSRVMEWDDVPGGGWKKLADGNNYYFTFLYANSRGGAHLTSGTNPEAVTVNGCAGTYYAPTGPLDGTWSKSRIFYDEETGSEIVATYYDPTYVAAVTWTNVEGVTFTIRGAFEKGVLLKMAESVSAG